MPTNGRHRNAKRAFTNDPPTPDLKRTLIVGAGSGGEIIARELRLHRQWKLWPVGFVDDDRSKSAKAICGIPVLADTAAIPAIVALEGIEVIVLAMPSAPQARLEEVARIAKSTGIDVVTMPSIGSILRGEERAETLRRVRTKDVLGRPSVEPDLERCLAFVSDRRVLITGAAGSIGRELALQVARLQPASLIILDIDESDLYDLQEDLRLENSDVEVFPIIASVTEEQRMDTVVRQTQPNIVFHAAAYKHVPLMEEYPGEAVRTNVLGTRHVARAAAALGVERFVLVSTDKAVRPSSVMGATKRLAEIVLADVSRRTGLSVCSVRFGNVLGSRGSVIPTFERQIRAGGPVTVTDARMRRYFMTVEEAASLIIQSGAFGDRNAISILDMGEDVSILGLAERVIELHGLRPNVDIPIEFTGIRAGEKLREDLANDFEAARESPHPKIRMLSIRLNPDDHLVLIERLGHLEALADTGKPDEIRTALYDLVQWADENEELFGSGTPTSRHFSIEPSH